MNGKTAFPNVPAETILVRDGARFKRSYRFRLLVHKAQSLHFDITDLQQSSDGVTDQILRRSSFIL